MNRSHAIARAVGNLVRSLDQDGLQVGFKLTSHFSPLLDRTASGEAVPGLFMESENVLRSSTRALDAVLFTVPIGQPSISAISFSVRSS
jgi:hypothetical protein